MPHQEENLHGPSLHTCKGPFRSPTLSTLCFLDQTEVCALWRQRHSGPPHSHQASTPVLKLSRQGGALLGGQAPSPFPPHPLSAALRGFFLPCAQNFGAMLGGSAPRVPRLLSGWPCMMWRLCPCCRAGLRRVRGPPGSAQREQPMGTSSLSALGTRGLCQQMRSGRYGWWGLCPADTCGRDHLSHPAGVPRGP